MTAFDKALDLIARYAVPVGFQRIGLPALEGVPAIPPSSILWNAPYAQMLVISLEETNENALRQMVRSGQEWLDLSCAAQERSARNVIDGYLVLLLSEVPGDALKVVIRELELDPTACRKHFAWPVAATNDADFAWARLLRVTSLGIPPSPELTGMTGSPLLDTPLQVRLLEDIKQLKGGNAARQHAENPSLAPNV